LGYHTIGVWRQVNGGVLLTITPERADFYHSSRFATYKDEEESGKPLSNTFARFSIEDDGDTLVLFQHDLGGRFDEFFSRSTFRRIPALPASTIFQPGEDPRFKQPQFVFDIFWHNLDEQYAVFAQREFDWVERRREFRPKLTSASTDEELYEMMTSALVGLGDSHTRVYWKNRDEPFRSGSAKLVNYLDAAFAQQTLITNVRQFRGNWVSAQKAAAVSDLAVGPLQRAAGGKIRFGMLKGDVGYMELDVVTGFGPADSSRATHLKVLEEELDRIVSFWSEAQAVIVDLSFNQGGADVFGATIASRFADRRRPVLSVYYAGQEPADARTLFIDPAGPRQFTRPVYVLTSNSTVSAGETLTLMLKAFPHVMQVGEATRGDLSSLLNKGMSNTFHVTLSNEVWLDANGASYEGRGVPPEIGVGDVDARFHLGVHEARDGVPHRDDLDAGALARGPGFGGGDELGAADLPRPRPLFQRGEYWYIASQLARRAQFFVVAFADLGQLGPRRARVWPPRAAPPPSRRTPSRTGAAYVGRRTSTRRCRPSRRRWSCGAPGKQGRPRIQRAPSWGIQRPWAWHGKRSQKS
jgi:carboxyl-terminal processing protease